MIHPLDVHVAQQADTLQFPHQLAAVLLLLGVQDGLAPLDEELRHLLPGQVVQLLGGVVEVLGGAQPAQVVAAQGGKIPLVGHVAGQEGVHAGLDALGEHGAQLGADVLPVQNLAALAVDDLALLVHHVVKLQHVFPDAEVAGFQLFLRALDGAGDHLVFDGHILFQAQGIHQALHPLAAKDPHQVIFQAQEEPAGAGVALTAGTAAQLVVDTAAFVPLGADDEQAAGLLDRLGFPVGLLPVLGGELRKPGPGCQDGLVGGIAVAVRLGNDLLGHFFLAQLGLGHELRVAAQHNVGTAAGHVGGDGHRPLLAGLSHDLSLPLVVLGVQHVVLDPPAGEHLAEDLALFNAHGAHQNRLALGVAFQHLLDYRVVLAVHRLVDAVRHILAGAGLVGGYGNDVEPVDLVELGGLGAGGTGHTGQLVVHTEVVLEGNGGQGLALGGHLNPFLGLDGLVQALVVAAADHQTAGELVHDDDLAVPHHVVDIPLHHAPGLDGLVDVVGQGHVLRVGQVVHMEPGLRLLHAGGGEGGALVLFVHHIVAVHLVVLLFLGVQLHHLGHLQGTGKGVGLLVQVAGVVPLAADDQRGTGLVDQDAVHLVHDGEVVAPLHHVLFIGDHVVPQVVEAELVVGAVGHVGGVGGLPGGKVDAGHDQAHAQPQEPVHLAHPLAVAAGQVIVDGNHVHPFAGKGVQVGGQGGHQGFAFTGLHLGDAAPVQGNAADDLHREVLHSQHTPAGLPADGERLGQQIVQAGTVGQTLAQRRGLGLQLGVGHGLVGGLQRQHLIRQRADLF